MSRLAKYTWIISSVITLSLVSAIIFLTMIADTNTFKPWITQWVKENKHRTLIFDGDIELSFYPKLGINLGPISLSEYKQDKVFASVEQAHIKLALLPLLRKQFIIDEITIQGLKTTIIRFQDGHTNIDDLITHNKETTTFSFNIGHAEIVATDILLKDYITNKIATFSNLNLKTGRLSTHSLNQIKLHSSGQITTSNTSGSTTFDFNLATTQIQLNDGYISSDPLYLSFNITDATSHLTGRLSISDFTHTDNQLKSELIQIELTSQKDTQVLMASINTSFIGKPDKQIWTLPDINSVLNLTHKEETDPPIKGQLSGNLIFNPLTETIQMHYTGKFANSPFQANLNLTNFTEKYLDLRLVIDQLDLNHFITYQTQPLIPNQKNTGKSKSNDQAEQGRALWPSFLEDLNITGLIHIGQLQIGDIQSTDIQLHIQPNNPISFKTN